MDGGSNKTFIIFRVFNVFKLQLEVVLTLSGRIGAPFNSETERVVYVRVELKAIRD